MLHPRGRRIGVDVGTVRIGVAVCDPDGILATPVETVPRGTAGKSTQAQDEAAVGRLAEIVAEYEAVGVIVGLPRDLAGREALAAESVRRFVEGFQRAVAPVPVEFVDERMTTVSAARSLREAGKDSRKARWLIDQAAAVTILQGWLDSVR
ncbi:MAG TPA: Holliday junction resolvase RuvX [Gordonia sp. (in: high G+C Gram-positive bacteria)]|uniref:Holliday junction resolvase RuvX n=1 Tax=unclassified Gordonia (in: high G+C Gram-positive bacteria) TaxID=2657482 RepID=UPI000F9F69C6|nr:MULTISPECIES: Holliday junction resolvase RuvX [unclassified Gordonia (in: high G+C Gram-positive bacteria)]RUP35609.1 MAG: Holliday junction resolvase RuvX [Gordonia sp. (in: high G+C Gram-positive bacteria)]HNP57738.1 Holliday junction resolvase RuvX [Gordonia sp. (in: high G+C Gram-positive bacteria)]HRC52779.1 Holliday junction resolvase RuvX [Gordonia sp. (in: high G+C Gram-positive bacteria)]